MTNTNSLQHKSFLDFDDLGSLPEFCRPKAIEIANKFEEGCKNSTDCAPEPLFLNYSYKNKSFDVYFEMNEIDPSCLSVDIAEQCNIIDIFKTINLDASLNTEWSESDYYDPKIQSFTAKIKEPILDIRYTVEKAIHGHFEKANIDLLSLVFHEQDTNTFSFISSNDHDVENEINNIKIGFELRNTESIGWGSTKYTIGFSE